jgi:hypothetical protein
MMLSKSRGGITGLQLLETVSYDQTWMNENLQWIIAAFWNTAKVTMHIVQWD